MSKKEAIIKKAIESIVRLHVTDGRMFIGRLMAIDTTKAVFLQDALEVHDKSAPEYLDHEIFSPNLLKGHNNKDNKRPLKFMGNVVINGCHVVKIELDHTLTEMFKKKMEELEEERKKEEAKAAAHSCCSGHHAHPHAHSHA